MAIRAGSLDQRIVLLASTPGRDGLGGSVATWSEVATLWARVVSSKGEESFVAAREQAGRTIKLQLRWRDGVTTAMRLRWQDETYAIVDIDTTLRGQGELWLMARLDGRGG